MAGDLFLPALNKLYFSSANLFDRAVEYQAACMFSSAEAEQLIFLWRAQQERSAEWDTLFVCWPVFSPESKIFSHCWFIPERGDNIPALFFFWPPASACLPACLPPTLSGCLGRCCTRMDGDDFKIKVERRCDNYGMIATSLVSTQHF